MVGGAQKPSAKGVDRHGLSLTGLSGDDNKMAVSCGHLALLEEADLPWWDVVIGRSASNPKLRTAKNVYNTV